MIFTRAVKNGEFEDKFSPYEMHLYGIQSSQ
jgi:hypothetical protein